ncbi:MAG TPA: hypothetical protein VK498_01720 [Ferruginibacter sp.]|nr:hypothetical protein [Ferruginibacter sp.]
MSHSISLKTAKEMTSLFRKQKETILDPVYQGQNIIPQCESFDAEIFKTLLEVPACVGVRIYYGMSDDLKLHAIIVGVNDKDEDILPAEVRSLVEEPPIIEEGVRCPPNCPPSSPLNS